MTLPRIPADPAWDPYLEDGEFLVWHGRPDGEKLVSRRSRETAIMSIGLFLFAGTMVVVMGDDLADAGMWPIWLIIGVVTLAALWMLIGTHFQERRKRQGTWYSLTNRRAFIATDLKGKRLSSWPINADTPLQLVRGSGDGRDYIYFAQEIIRSTSTNSSDRIEMIGFELIKDADAVFDLFERVQRGET